MAGRTLPDGRPVPDGAPDEDILDQQDLRQIADALRAGKHVGLSADGKVHVFENTDGTPGMDATSEAFIEDHLGEVRSFLQMGFNASIHPDGRIWGHSADDKFKFQTDEVVALTDADRAEIRTFVASGADVAITPDGTVQFTQHPGLPVRTLAEADAVMAFIQEETTSGRMAQQAAEGRGLVISGNRFRGEDLQPRYVDAPDIPGIRLPDPVPDPDATGVQAPAAPTTAQPARTDAEEAEQLTRYADDLAERARLVRQAADAAARGDEAESNRLLDQSRIELVEEPADLVPEAPAPTLVVPPSPRPAPDPPHVPTEQGPSGLPGRPGRPAGEFDGPIGALDGTTDGTRVAALDEGTGTVPDITGAGDVTGAADVTGVAPERPTAVLTDDDPTGAASVAAAASGPGIDDAGGEVTGTGAIGADDVPASALDPIADAGVDAAPEAPASGEPEPVVAPETDFSSSSDFADTGAVDDLGPADDLGAESLDA